MEIGVAVGSSFLSSFLQVLFDRMAKPEFLNLFREPKYDVSVLLDKLQRKLLILQPVLDDAENKQTKDPAVKKWLEELQDVVYQADDLLDEINTEALRVMIEGQHQSPIDQVSASTDTSNFSTQFLKDIMPSVQEVVNSLEEFKQQIHDLGLVKKGESKKQPFRLSSTSLVDETDVYGRDTDRDRIIEELLSDGANGDKVTVISIFGLGGLGKTTLAQFVYNDPKVREHFVTKAWVCISEDYDIIRITKELLQELKIRFESKESFNSLQEKLKQGLSMKRFLLVLDDAWNRDYMGWSTLSTPFNGGKEGSKIIVTTRDVKVARMMGSRYIHELAKMSEEDGWLLFKKHAINLRAPTGNSEFDSIGKDILRKCGGLPLAVKAIAGVLRSKETVEEWKEILTSDEWEEMNNQTGILPSLRLSYNHLPPQLKGCFTFCAVFPKDYPFSKDEVGLLWMANGLLENTRGNRRPEDRGDEFFLELRARSLFQGSSDGRFSMHDLVNDLAKFVAGKYVYRQEDHQQQNTSLIGVTHFSFLCDGDQVFEKFKLLNQAKFLRTFLPIHFTRRVHQRFSRKLLQDILPGFKSLRILSLSRSNIAELPNFVTNLKQLRFLDLSFTPIKKLPSQICTLDNLQTLLLARCDFLDDFPEGMEKLINLRHLDLSGVRLSKMPMQIEGLKGLQFLSLPTYAVGTDGGSRIEDLGKLCNLYGELTIVGLENVANGKKAFMAGMKDKKHIKKLSLIWSNDGNDSQVVKDVLENLQPHLDIEYLEIEGYCGTTFSNWFGDSSYSHMISLYLVNCENCFCLPALGQLPVLKYLIIRRLNKVLELGEGVYGDTSVTKPFPCLEQLTIDGMPEWQKWHIPENGAFSGLKDLSIVDCPKLMGDFPMLLPLLEKLKIHRCPGLVSKGRMTIFDTKVNLPQQFSSLRHLMISNMPNLESSDLCKLLPNLKTSMIEDCCKYLTHTLESTTIEGCSELQSLLEKALPASLSKLDISHCPKLQSLPEKGLPASLSTLSIYHCPEFRSLPEKGLPASLSKLSIHHCREFRSLPEKGLPTSLSELSIYHCHEFRSLPEKGLPASLSLLRICNCPQFRSLPEKGLPASLSQLRIRDCPEFRSLPEKGLPASLSQLHIRDCPKFQPLPEEGLPTSLSRLNINNCPEFRLLPEKGLPASLSKLSIYKCPEFRSLPERGLPASLSLLSIYNCPEFRSLPEKGLPASLSQLSISYCPEFRSLPEKGLLASLSQLHIYYCPEFRSLPEKGLLPSLSKLYILECPKLQSLPEEGLPTSLSKLYIIDCQLLKPRLEWEKGEDWHKIAHIRHTEVDFELIP